MQAKDVMSDGVMSIAGDATVREAIELLAKTRVSAMPVLDDGGVMIGIVSEADLIAAAGLDAAAVATAMSRPVVEIMTRDVVTAGEQASLAELAESMRKHRIKRVPILRGDSVVGVVSRLDLLKGLIATDAGARPAGEVAGARRRGRPLLWGAMAVGALAVVAGLVAMYLVPPPSIGPATPPIAAAEAFAKCLQGSDLRGIRAKAVLQVANCSAAIQSRQLTPTELATARLNRGAARAVLGDRTLAGGDYLEALRHYDGAIDPSQPDALNLYRRGAALDALGQSDRALRDYNQAIRLDPRYPLAYYARGVLLAGYKRTFDRAIGDFDKVLVLEPGNVAALIRRGEAYGKLGDFGNAMADLDRAAGLAPDDPEVYVYRGIVNGWRREGRRAMDDFNAALRLDADNVNALVNRAAVYAGDRLYDLAIRDLDAAIALQGNDALAFYNRGYALFATRKYELAIADYGTAISHDPTMGLAYNNRCLVRTIVGRDLVAALTDCDMALKLMPTNLDVRETRGFIYLKLGDPAIAIVEYSAVLDVDPNRAFALFGRGLARRKMGLTSEGNADQAAARALDPSIETRFSVHGVD